MQLKLVSITLNLGFIPTDWQLKLDAASAELYPGGRRVHKLRMVVRCGDAANDQIMSVSDSNSKCIGFDSFEVHSRTASKSGSTPDVARRLVTCNLSSLSRNFFAGRARVALN